MAIRTPEPRLPLEPEEYPLYQPPRRVGCSGITIVTLLAIGTFLFLVWRVTPPMAKAITDFPKSIPILGPLLDDGDEETEAGAATFPTQTAEALASPVITETTAVVAAVSPTVAPTSTPVPEYVRVANTGGQGVRLRKEPRQNAEFEVVAREGTVFQIIGPDTPDPTDSSITWRNVVLPNDGRQGYVQKRYLEAAPGPNP
ncbi:MAG: hypothetical protein M3441_14310 [Chloroflexota bacterium]|nr:hypothetical protein [Chloroflexota bacterium]